jgi:O-antigen/teichoic acid export membrane protein
MKVLKSFSVYIFVGVFGAMVGLLVMPVLTNYLSPKDYGIIALFNTYTSLIVPIIGIAAAGLISVEYFNKKNSKMEFSSIYSSVLSIPILPAILLSILAYTFQTSISPIIDIPSSYIIFIPLLAFLTYYFNNILSYLTIIKKAKTYASLNISKVIFEVSLTLILILIYKMDWKGRIDSWFVTLILIFIFILIYSYKNNLLTIHIKKKHILAGIAFGSPLILHTLGAIVITQSDRVFISKMVSIDEMGVYNTGFQIGSILLIVARAFVNIYNPFLYERLADITEKKKIEILRLSYIFIIGMGLLLLIITMLAPYFYEYFINKRFAGGIKYVFWIGLGYLFWGAYWLFSGFILYFKKTKILAYLAVLNVVMNLSFNYFLIKAYGASGAAYATALSFFIIFLLVAFISSRIFPMPWLNFKMILSNK